MKIIVDGREFRGRLTGISRYVIHLIQGLNLIRTDIHWLLISDGAIDLPQFSDNVEAVVFDHLWPSIFYERLRMGQTVACLNGDVFFSPYYKCPPKLNIPSIATINDLIPLAFSSWPYRAYFKYNLVQSLKAASKLITISDYVKDQLTIFLRSKGIEKEITTVPCCVTDQFGCESGPNDHSILSKYDLVERSYILYVGNQNPHKNLQRLVDAYMSIQIEDKKIPDLVLSCGDKKSEPVSNGGKIRWLGGVLDSDLPALYRGALFFVFPSLSEGFGLPPLEAMASGTPVLVSNKTAIPEVVGTAGLYFDPYLVEDMSQKMAQYILNADLRNRYREEGLQRSRQFAIRRTAQAFQKVLETLFP